MSRLWLPTRGGSRRPSVPPPAPRRIVGSAPAGGRLARLVDGHPGMRATSAHTRALGLFDAASTLGARGIPIGDVLSGGGLFVHDPFTVYEAGVTTDPNMCVLGLLGQRKSTLMKVLLSRQWVFGRQMRVVDIKGEYSPLAEYLGGTVIRLSRGGGVRLNPLASAEDRQELLRAVARAVLPRDLAAEEPALLNTALDQVAQATVEPTLPAVIDALFNPTAEMADQVSTTPARFAREARPVAMALQPLVAGDLKGMFDGPTSPGLDFGAQLVVLDLSEMINSASLGILMSCAGAFLQAAIDRQRADLERGGQPAPKTILVLDEAWAVFAVPGIGEWLCQQFKLARRIGQANVCVMHRFSDLDAAGDDGSRTVKLAQGLIDDCQTFVIFRLEGDELADAVRILSLSGTEQERISRLHPGQALWRVGQQRFVVQTAVSSIDLPLTNTDQKMRIR
jgi:type IV secretory pathway VirB4 component